MNILGIWQRLERIPGGKCLFSLLARWFVPYTGSVRPCVLELKPGYARVRMKDRRRVRNHLDCIHAAALMNIAEAASGLAFNCGLSRDKKAILTAFSITYLKKARGILTAECTSPLKPDSLEDGPHPITALVRNRANDIVAQATATWLLHSKNTAQN